MIIAAVLVMGLASTASAQVLRLAVETIPQEPRPGQQVQTRLIVGNPGTTTASDLRLELIYPDGFSLLANSQISDGGNCAATGFSTDCRPGEPVVWNLGDLPPGQSRSVYLAPRLGTTIADGSMIDFAATVFVSSAPDVFASQTLEVKTVPVLALALEADADPAAPGQRLDYVLHYAHLGPSATTNTELRLPLPSGVEFVSAAANGMVANGEVIWELGLLNPGEQSRRSVTVDVLPGMQPGDVLAIEGARISGQFEFETTGALANSVVGLASADALAVAITVGDDHARPGAPAWIQITASNQSTAALTDLVIELPYPEGLNTLPNNRILDGGNCAASGFSTDCRTGERVNWALGPLAPGESRTVALAPIVSSSASTGQALVYQARARAANTLGRWARQIIRVEPNSALRLGLAARSDSIAPDETLELNLSYGNSGGGTASNSVLELPLPEGVVVAEISDEGSVVDGRVVWNLGLLDPGEIGRRFVVLTPNPGLPAGTLLHFNQARLSGTISFIERQAHARAVARIGAAPGLTGVLTVGPNPALGGEQTPAEFLITNRSPAVLAGVRVELIMPEGFMTMPNSIISDGGNCTGSGFSTDCRAVEPIIWMLGNLPPGQGRSVRFQPVLGNSPEPGALHRFEARARSDDGGEIWSRQHVQIAAAPELSLHVDASSSVVSAGDQVDYVLSFANASAAALTAGRLDFPLPPGMSLVEAEGANLIDDRLEWPVSLLQSGENDSRRATLQVSAGAMNGRVLEGVEARLTGMLGLKPAFAAARSAIRVEAPGALDLAIDLAPDPVQPGERLVPRLTASNRSGGVLTAVRVDMPFPDLLNNLQNNLITSGGNCAGSVFSADCRRAEPVIWDLGTLPPDSGKTFWLPPQISNSAGSARLIRLRPRVVADGQRPRHAETTIATRTEAELDLSLEFDPAPAAAGSPTRIRLHFGNRSGTSISDAVLRLRLPDGTQVMSVDGNGIVGDNELLWQIGPIPAGRVGQRELELAIDADGAPGSLIRALDATLSGLIATTPVRASASGTLRIGALRPLGITLDFIPRFAAPGTTLAGQLTVTNNTATPMPDVTAAMYFPSFLSNLANSAIGDGGNCSSSGFSTDCRSGETVRWALGTLAAGETRVLGIEPTVTSAGFGPPDGSLLRFFAVAENTVAGQADARATVLIGDFLPPPPPPIPAIALSGNGQPIVNGSSAPGSANGTDFGTADIKNDPRDQVFVIANAGTGVLQLSGSPRVTVTGPQASEFKVVGSPPATIEAGQSANFTIRFQPDNLGARQSVVTIANNVADQNPYTFAIRGEGSDSTGQLLFRDGFE